MKERFRKLNILFNYFWVYLDQENQYNRRSVKNAQNFPQKFIFAQNYNSNKMSHSILK